jgi:nucleoside-diphosphate kinase
MRKQKWPFSSRLKKFALAQNNAAGHVINMKNLVLSALLVLSPFCALQGEKTLAIIKPDAVEAHHMGEIITVYEKSGLTIVDMKMIRMSKRDAEQFYAVHKERPFFSDLVSFMSSGPAVAIVLEGDNAIKKNREIIGATDPKDAAPGTIRKEFAASKSKNAVHGSDSPEAAETEIGLLFKS